MATKSSTKVGVYSVRLEIDGAVKVLTIRVGDGFTELSLARNGKLAEVAREENGEIIFEKVK